ncbi:hypothetical protein K0M31_007915 [Melipona bicolor]|uniref:MICOS complex subunit MIC13 n=1 Tax=Melipona bicolor TaxID=60889 RepID=A0AA40GCJ6_9HYME|nr:hypothetical protein K0M31_007915 [Melipona bicolor]
MELVRFAIKSSIVGGSIYYTYTEGLWSKSEETAKLYEKLYTNLAPYVKENIPEEVIKEWAQLPSVSCATSFVKTSWNNGVISSMKFISDLPAHTTSLYETAEKYIKTLNI